MTQKAKEGDSVQTEQLFTVREAVSMLRQSRLTIYRKIERGELRAVRLGERGPFRIPLDAIHEHMQPVETKGASE